MNKQINSILMILSIFLVTILAGCGGGGGGGGGVVSSASAKMTGTFVDAPVAGLSYTTSSGGSGTTNALGQFNYVKGDTVTFKAGGITLGSAAPTANLNGTSALTPVNLAGSSANTSSPAAIAIGQLLAALNEVAQALGVSSAGTFTIPSGTPALLAALQSAGTDITTLEAALTSGALQTGLQTVASSAVVPASSVVQTNLTQGANTAPFANTIWKGVCVGGTGCGNGVIYLEPDGIVTGFSQPGTSGGKGNLLNGSWTPSTTANGGILVGIIDHSGCTTSFQIGASATSTTFTTCNSTPNVIALTQITAAAALTNTIYLGGWYAVPSAPVTGGAYFIIAPDGSINGISADGNTITGTCNLATGSCTAMGSGTNGGTASFTLTSATSGSGTLTSGSNGTVTLTLSRTGAFVINTGSNSCTSNCGGFSSGGSNGTLATYTVPLTITDTSGASLTGVQVCVNNVCGNPAVNGGTGFTLSGGSGSGSLSVSLPAGVNYSVYVPAGQQFGSASCSVTSGGSGVTGASTSLPASVSCVNGSSTSGLPLQLEMNVQITWVSGGSCIGCSASMTLDVKNGSNFLVSANTMPLNNPNNGTATYTGITNQTIAVTYPSTGTGPGDIYNVSLTNTSGTPNAACTITSSSFSGSVSDVNAGNPGAYPLIGVRCSN